MYEAQRSFRNKFMYSQGAEELVSDGSKQLAEKARSEVAQMKKQLESQVHIKLDTCNFFPI